jgi:hypothetical protein
VAGHPFPPIVETLRRAAAALRDHDVPFVLGGSLAAWARGGPETTKDLDLLVRPRHAEAALAALAEAGLRIEQPPEEWLSKAWDGDVLVDVIFRLISGPVDDGIFARAEEMNVASVRMPVMALEDMLVARLLALDDHHLDLAPLLLIGRSLREQVDWEQVRRRTAHSPHAAAYLTLLEGLGVIGPPEAGGATVSVLPRREGVQDSGAFGPAGHDVH